MTQAARGVLVHTAESAAFRPMSEQAHREGRQRDQTDVRTAAQHAATRPMSSRACLTTEPESAASRPMSEQAPVGKTARPDRCPDSCPHAATRPMSGQACPTADRCASGEPRDGPPTTRGRKPRLNRCPDMRPRERLARQDRCPASQHDAPRPGRCPNRCAPSPAWQPHYAGSPMAHQLQIP